MSNTKLLLSNALSAVKKTANIQELNQVRTTYLGKKGELVLLLKSVGQLPHEERKQAAQLANLAKNQLTQAISDRQQTLDDQKIELRLSNEKIDVSLPGKDFSYGSIHPITLMINRIEEIFSSLGFQSSEGPEIEDDFHNFSSLNIAQNHPARDMHDTFYFNSDLILRTHTSSVQIREMNNSNNEPPYKIIASGSVYRCDYDQTHTPMFHQIEGLFVDKQVSLTDLFGLLSEFFKLFFNDSSLKVRFRPSYFPFTEPSAEVDISTQKLRNNDWLEVLGCGMVHPNVLKNCGLDSEVWNGYAFGLGVERLAMLYYNVSDLRQFYGNDLRFLRQFS